MWATVGDHHPWQRIITSPLRRCRDFAEALGERHGIPVAEDARLREIGFGAWEGRTAEELLAEDPDRLHRFWADPLHNTPPGAETLPDFAARVVGAWKEILALHAGEHLLLVGHAGMMRMILRHVLDMPLDRLFRIQIANAAISRVQVDGEGEAALPRLIFHAGRL